VEHNLIIDTHIHLHRTRELGFWERTTYEVWEYGKKGDVQFSEYGGDIDDVLQALELAKASKGVLVNLFEPKTARDIALRDLPDDLDEAQRLAAKESIEASVPDMLVESNKWFCRIAAEHGQLVAFIGIDPSTMSGAGAQEHMREMVERHGARGLKLHPVLQGFHLHDDRMRPILDACIELDLPIISHSGPARGSEQFAEPESYAPALELYPDLRLVLAHLGGGAWRQTAEFAGRYPGVAFDCSEIIQWTGAPNAPTDEQLARLMLEVGTERVMLGSDFPWYGIGHSAQRVMDLPLLSDDQKKAILGQNALRILSL
jgi:predicted TIM-barrel fold metal-dependent hydrolase